ncbi:MAG: hypothetical protein A2186_03840 [Candidatus Levybacteria bacterium RIFOXYA1_FULL_41_10]|nr:MAG: hypothetical protein UT44_C0025G0008 [Candidatus Levybacteria bacterium GW2011_GWA1_39_32]KKR73783.1 MAG: hypothetical protein UU15_C0002G0027 [Candidatus Levybacteria bacterium GW2011_GWC2_40_7]KKR95243.1 MAG: hypothetical protein UU45_C0003G0029 [Candidatus Levybacteria bacterium GW2011_GWA2_41_15]OGH25172.1 MAG: hypothetical protein A3D82_00865 [Candidatus Levybacteria bacterium RIFCSPHIGHO2_02_FULL_40_29]OGH32719.1 MAG: hypothetical protein A3E70_00475 [Candidatus Levybacteria bacte
MKNFLLIFLGKLILKLSRLFNLGSGSTWPGHIAISINPNFTTDVLRKSKSKIIIIAGTNGKTTTSLLIQTILEGAGYKTLHNKSGANLENGIASTLLEGISLGGRLPFDFLLFESDENTLPNLLEQINPDYLVLLNLFRDQLDRYGELDSIAKKWKKGIYGLLEKSTLILNADDPQISFFSEDTRAKTYFFGIKSPLSGSSIAHGADSIFCPKCSSKLTFSQVFYSHLGIWSCTGCGLKRKTPQLSASSHYPLEGLHNKYNVNAASLLAKVLRIPQSSLNKSLTRFEPAFGRQEKLIVDNKSVQIYLSKNPTSLNETLSILNTHKATDVLIILNDRVPDGLDVSWIWDVNFENHLSKNTVISVSGDRLWDMSLRLKYAGFKKIISFPNLDDAIKNSLENTRPGNTLFILPNYSAMLETRKILTGKKIL